MRERERSESGNYLDYAVVIVRREGYVSGYALQVLPFDDRQRSVCAAPVANAYTEVIFAESVRVRRGTARTGKQSADMLHDCAISVRHRECKYQRV